MNCRIICIGNRLLAEDSVALLVFDRLQQRALPQHIKLTEGGLMGLNLLPLLEQGGRVVFVDTVSGFTEAGSLIVLDRAAIIASGADHYDHNAGLAYVLSVLPKVCDGELPEEILLVGIEGQYTEQLINEAVNLTLSIALYGRP